MRVLIVGLIVLALSVAGISTYLIRSFSSQEALKKLEEEAEPVKFRVLLASRDVNPGEIINKDQVVWQDWPGEPPNAQYIVAEQEEQKAKKQNEIIGSVARKAIVAGEPILASKLFKRDEAGFMAGILKKGMRAVTINVNVSSSVAGFILPGDRVDIMLVHDKVKEALRKTRKAAKPTRGDGPPPPQPLRVLNTTTETILRDILILAVDQALVSPEGNPAVAKTLTLELTPKQGEIITTARTMGQLSLVLRGLASADEEPTARTYTTDVEVSPFMSAIEKRLKGKQVDKEKKLANRIRDLEKEMADRDEIMNAMMRKLQKQSKDQARDMRSKLRKLETAKTSREKELDAAVKELQLEKKEKDLMAQENTEELEALRRQREAADAAPVKKAVAKPEVKPEEKKEPVKVQIFRGGAAKTQEVTVK